MNKDIAIRIGDYMQDNIVTVSVKDGIKLKEPIKTVFTIIVTTVSLLIVIVVLFSLMTRIDPIDMAKIVVPKLSLTILTVNLIISLLLKIENYYD